MIYAKIKDETRKLYLKFQSEIKNKPVEEKKEQPKVAAEEEKKGEK